MFHFVILLALKTKELASLSLLFHGCLTGLPEKVFPIYQRQFQFLKTCGSLKLRWWTISEILVKANNISIEWNDIRPDKCSSRVLPYVGVLQVAATEQDRIIQRNASFTKKCLRPHIGTDAPVRDFSGLRQLARCLNLTYITALVAIILAKQVTFVLPSYNQFTKYVRCIRNMLYRLLDNFGYLP